MSESDKIFVFKYLPRKRTLINRIHQYHSDQRLFVCSIGDVLGWQAQFVAYALQVIAFVIVHKRDVTFDLLFAARFNARKQTRGGRSFSVVTSVLIAYIMDHYY